MNKKKNNTFNNILLILGAAVVPYIYYFTIRPKLIKFEETLDSKLTDISDTELNKMKIKMQMMKSGKQNENEELNNKE